MSPEAGIGLAFVAMLCWGFGDFLIQRSTRKIGDWETLFIITLFGAVVFLPFVYREFAPLVFGSDGALATLLMCSVVLFIAALLDFEALRVGKLAVVEPIWSFEIPASALLAFYILGERISAMQIALIVFLIIGLCLVSFREKHIKKEFFMEKGILLAFAAAFLMGGANFFMGWGSRLTNPLIANFFTDVFIAVFSGFYILFRHRGFRTIRDTFKNYGLLLTMSIADKAAWVAFAFSMVLAPIGIAVALSESYIIIAVLLGFFANREAIQRHQKIGLVIAILAAITLAAITA